MRDPVRRLRGRVRGCSMNPQSPGTGGRGPYDSWGRPYGASRQPGPAATRAAATRAAATRPRVRLRDARRFPRTAAERPAGRANGNAKGRSRARRPAPDTPGAGSWSVGPSGSPIPGMSAKDFQKMCRSVDKAFSQFARMVDQGVNEAAEALGQSPRRT